MSNQTGEQPSLNVETGDRVDSVLLPAGILTLSGILTYKGIESGPLSEAIAGGILGLGGLATAAVYQLRLRRPK